MYKFGRNEEINQFSCDFIWYLNVLRQKEKQIRFLGQGYVKYLK